LLNRAARYFPIIRELKRVHPGAKILDVGAGPIGIGEFWPGSFVGCDIHFPESPRDPMRPVVCLGTQLPFTDRLFDAVVVSDVMEHVPPKNRAALIREVLRVTRVVAIFGYPCGPLAFALDKKLHEGYQRSNIAVPIWLEEHMLYPFPEEDLFSQLQPGWSLKVFPNESLRFHYWMMRTEMHRLFDYALRLSLIVMPRIVERLLLRVDRDPSYRKIFVLERQEYFV
jgi:Methyltransferase domain